MQVIVLSNGKLEVKEIENTLENLQSIVGGYIEIPLISKVFRQHNIDTVINEEGKFIEGLKPEIAIIDGKSILDVVYGNCVFVSHDETGNTIGLTDEQIKIVMTELNMEVNLSYKDSGKEFMAKALFIWQSNGIIKGGFDNGSWQRILW